MPSETYRETLRQLQAADPAQHIPTQGWGARRRRHADVAIREADDGDRLFYWKVNNAPTTRALSISTDPIPWSVHERWFFKHLAADATTLCVAEADGVRVGVVRFDHDGTSATISIALSPEHQGRGLGRRIIAESTQATLLETHIVSVIALIRPDNIARVRAFEAAGYERVGPWDTNSGLLRYEAII